MDRGNPEREGILGLFGVLAVLTFMFGLALNSVGLAALAVLCLIPAGIALLRDAWDEKRDRREREAQEEWEREWEQTKGTDRCYVCPVCDRPNRLTRADWEPGGTRRCVACTAGAGP